MAQAYHVPGPAQLKVGTGNANALEVLGIAEDGVDLTLRHHKTGIRTDVAGTEVPAEFQHMGMDAIIRAKLATYDSTVLNKMRLRSGGGDAAAEGQIGTLGRLIGTSGDAFRVLITSSDEPWNFLTCILHDAQDSKIGTRSTVWNIVMYSWPLILGNATSPTNTTLWNRTTS